MISSPGITVESLRKCAMNERTTTKERTYD
jgi:hypothetical protein